MQLPLYIFYLVLCCSFLYYYKVNTGTGISIRFLLLLFIIKVVAGTVNMYIHFYLYVTNDIGFFYWQAINQLKGMKFAPGAFFYDLFFNWGDIRTGFDLSSGNASAFWKDLGVLFHTKFMLLSNMLSLGQQYVNVILYNIPFFIGQLYLYKTFYRRQPEKKWLFVLVIFLIPSVLFWCSGIHKDGWILVAIGMMVYSLDKFLETRFRKYLVTFFVFSFFLFVMRYFFLVCMIPALVSWVLSHKRKHAPAYFVTVYLLSAVLFFLSPYFGQGFNLMKLVSGRQHEFMQLRGYSDMQTPVLEDHFVSYVKGFPSAVNHIFTQPRYSQQAPFKYKFSAIDTILVLGLIIFFSLFIKRKNFSQPIYQAIFFYSLSVYLFIGYTIPNCGALVRYKSEFTVLLLAALVAMGEIPRLNNYLNRKLVSLE